MNHAKTPKYDGEKRLQWSKAVEELFWCGFITEPHEIEPGVWAATHTGHGFAACAAELAANLPGQLWPGDRSVSWVCGKPSGRLIDAADVPDLKESQIALRALGIDLLFPWSRGRIARAIMSWAVDPLSCQGDTRFLLDDMPMGYHDCIPGVYRSNSVPFVTPNIKDLFDEPIGVRNADYKPGATMYDAKSYYFTILCRAESPRVRVGRRVYFDALNSDEKARWKDALMCVSEDKILRNSLVGCAMGSDSRIPVYSQDKTRPGRSKRRLVRTGGGPFKTLGHLIIRSGGELCNLASWQVNSVYSTTDSVVCLTDDRPTIWEENGITVKKEAYGNTHIHSKGVWRCGTRQTKTYRGLLESGMWEKLDPVSVPRMEPPSKLWYKEWL